MTLVWKSTAHWALDLTLSKTSEVNIILEILCLKLDILSIVTILQPLLTI